MRLVVFLLISVSCFAKGLPVSVQSKRAVVMNAASGAVLFEKNAHERAAPASTTKIATALYALENYSIAFDERVKCIPKCLASLPKSVKQERGYSDPPYYLEPDGTTFDLVKGEVISMEALFYGMMLASGNDAANLIAHTIGGSIEKFIFGMNDYLASLGCENTNFANPHGLHYPDHYTTVYDMALMTKEALKNETLRSIVQTVTYTRPETNKSKGYEITQGNRLLRNGQYNYPRAIGFKTGYIEDAGYCLSAVAKEGERELIAVLFGGESALDRYRDAIALFDAAFAEERMSRKLFERKEPLGRHSLPGGRKEVRAHLKEACSISYYPSEEPEVSASITWHDLTPPVKKHSEVGTLVVTDQKGAVIAEEPLFAAKSVRPTRSFVIKSHIEVVVGALVVISLLTIYFLRKRRA